MLQWQNLFEKRKKSKDGDYNFHFSDALLLYVVHIDFYSKRIRFDYII